MGETWRTAAMPWLQLASGTAALLAADHACHAACAAAGISFPSALIGMFVLVAGLTAQQEAGERVHAWFRPALAWVQRWMALFYAPFLVALPCNAAGLLGPQLPQILLLLAGGVAVHMTLTGQFVMAIQRRGAASQPQRKAEDPEVSEASSAVQDEAAAIGRAATVPNSALATAWGTLAAAAFSAVLLQPAGPHAARCGAAFTLAATVLGYVGGAALPPRVQTYVHPVAVCGIVANAAAAALGHVQVQSHTDVLHDYISKGGGGKWLLKFLGVIILSFAFRLFERRRLIVQHAAAILGGVTFSVAFSLFGTALAGRLLQLPPDVARALVPRAVTAALALPIAEGLGAPLAVTAAAVVCTGVLGAAMARPLLDRTGCTDPLARGIAAVSAAHGMATAALGSAEPEALPFAALGYALAGIFASVFCAAPPVRQLLLTITG